MSQARPRVLLRAEDGFRAQGPWAASLWLHGSFPALTALSLLALSCSSATGMDGDFNEWSDSDAVTREVVDSDGDTLSDDHEGRGEAVDTDADGLPDYLDTDSDSDTLPDSLEAGDGDPATPPRDSDGDGTADFRESDSDGNGIFDPVEGTGDADADGVPDFQDLDNDGDGLPDAAELGGSPANPPDSDGDGIPDYMDNDGMVTAREVCDQLDNDGDGEVDENCPCEVGGSQPCYDGPPATRGVGACSDGVQACEGSGEFRTWGDCTGSVTPSWEHCFDLMDNDCDGLVDCLDTEECGLCDENCYDGLDDDFDGLIDCHDPDCPPCEEICGDGLDNDMDGLVDCDDPDCPCVIEVSLDLSGDCITTSCPPEAPYPVGCSIVMAGGDSRGCVANAANDSVIYFQEGDCCGSGHVGGTLFCSSVPGDGLNASNCTINKTTKYYPPSSSGCPVPDCNDD